MAFFRRLAASIPVLLVCGTAEAELQFEKALVYLERNATDDDVEVVFAATSNEKGLAVLRVIAPDGRTVIDFKAPDSKLGIRHVAVETSEPRLNDGGLQVDFPPGVYRFEGTLVDGGTLRSEATLSHVLPDATIVTSPREDLKNVLTKSAKVRWTAVKDAVFYVVAIQERGKQREIKMTLPGSSTSFSIPDGFLVGDTEYKVEIGAVLQSGNRTFVERNFSAAKR